MLNPYFLEPQDHMNGLMATCVPMIFASMIMTSIMLNSYGINMLDLVPETLKSKKTD